MLGLYNNIYAILKPDNPEVEKIKPILQLKEPNYKYSKAFQNWVKLQNLLKQGIPSEEAEKLVPGPYWDGIYRFYHESSKGFMIPTGFIFSDRLGYLRPMLQDVRPGTRGFGEPKVYGIVLRDYQLEAVSIALKKQRGIIAAATNSGKTEIAAAIISAIRKPTLFVVHRSNLALQTLDRFKERIGTDKITIFGMGNKDFDAITIATVQSLSRYIKQLREAKLGNGKLDAFEVIFVDEAHHSHADQYRYILRNLPKTFWRFGLTGTPHRNMRSHKWWYFIAGTGDILYEIKNEQLIKMGISANTNILFYTFVHEKSYYRSKWQEVYREAIEDNLERNLLIKALAEENSPGVFIAVRTIRHGVNLQRLIKGSILLTGNETPEERAKAVQKFAEGEISCIIATGWFYEGMDVPQIKTLINASGGLSEIELLQKLGRGLRKKSDNSDLLFLDIYDVGAKYIEEHSESRINTLKKDGHLIKVIS